MDNFFEKSLKLKGAENFEAWDVNLELLCQFKECWEVVYEDVAEPDGAAAKKAWKKQRVTGLLLLSKLLGRRSISICDK
jgi:hypothetical protein